MARGVGGFYQRDQRGGRGAVKMADLRAAFESMGFLDVRTVLASGNIVFHSPDPGSAAGEGAHQEREIALAAQIALGLESALGRRMAVCVRSMENLRHLVASHPFAKVAGTPGVRLNITFLLRPDQDGSDFEFESPKGDLWAKRISDGEVAGMVVPSPGLGTLDLMALVEKRFGSEVTTRTWSTVKKLVALGG